mmetsp:Transcript_30115/g.36799  ORF Transcript_30115/g.36799 Transcript_30115/m.36799 type:complete len:218 (-) Transcript_30115:1014-1667(-)
MTPETTQSIRRLIFQTCTLQPLTIKLIPHDTLHGRRHYFKICNGPSSFFLLFIIITPFINTLLQNERRWLHDHPRLTVHALDRLRQQRPRRQRLPRIHITKIRQQRSRKPQHVSQLVHRHLHVRVNRATPLHGGSTILAVAIAQHRVQRLSTKTNQSRNGSIERIVQTARKRVRQTTALGATLLDNDKHHQVSVGNARGDVPFRNGGVAVTSFRSYF